jgi:hypothetical protein
MAVSQATALNVMFARLSSVALQDIRHPHFDSLMRLALRAQTQCSRTLDTLTKLKNPSVFANQLNVAHQQIVNNAPAPPSQNLPPTSELSSASLSPLDQHDALSSPPSPSSAMPET